MTTDREFIDGAFYWVRAYSDGDWTMGIYEPGLMPKRPWFIVGHELRIATDELAEIGACHGKGPPEAEPLFPSGLIPLDDAREPTPGSPTMRSDGDGWLIKVHAEDGRAIGDVATITEGES